MSQLTLTGASLAISLALVATGLLLALLPARDLGAVTSHQLGLLALVAGTMAVVVSTYRLAGEVDWGEMPRHW